MNNGAKPNTLDAHRLLHRAAETMAADRHDGPLNGAVVRLAAPSRQRAEMLGVYQAVSLLFAANDLAIDQWWRIEAAHGFGDRLHMHVQPYAAQGQWLARAPRSTALATALGMLQARETLEEHHWVVAIVDGDLDVDLARERLAAFERLQRFLLVWCQADDLGTNGAAHTAASRNYRSRAVAGSLGLRLVGPVKARQHERLTAVIEQIKSRDEPALLQVRLSSSSIQEADQPAKAPALWTSDAVGEGESPSQAAGFWLTQQAEIDSRVVVVDMVSDHLFLFTASFPDRHFPVASNQEEAIAWCAGLAAGGCRPYLRISPAHAARCASQLADHVCGRPHAITLLLEAAADADLESAAHCVPALLQIPVAIPCDCGELAAMLDFSLYHEGPAAIWLEPRLQPVSAPAPRVRLGQGEAADRGEDLLILSAGPAFCAAREAAELLAGHGIDAAAVNLRFLRPLDGPWLLEAVGKARSVVVVEPLTASGLTGDVLALLASQQITAPFTCVAPDDAEWTATPGGRSALVQQITRQCLAFTREWMPGGSDPFPPPAARPCPPAAGALSRVSTVFPEIRPEILAERLTSTVEEWVRAYSAVGPRNLYLWKWCSQGVRLTTLPCVQPELQSHSCDTKVLSIMINVLLDDVADRREDGPLLPVLMQVTRDAAPDTTGLSPRDRAHVEFTERVWREYWRRAEQYPRFESFRDLLRYDLIQLFNSIHYSSLLNRQLGLLNVVEHDLYSPHNMMMMSFATLDLMCSPEFDVRELGKLREAVWHAQWMGRIGNLLSTWQREIEVGDFTSGVFARAVALGDLTVEQLARGDRAQIESAIHQGQHHRFYGLRWNHHRRCFLARAAEIRSAQVERMLEGHERFFRMHLGSQGFI